MELAWGGVGGAGYGQCDSRCTMPERTLKSMSGMRE